MNGSQNAWFFADIVTFFCKSALGADFVFWRMCTCFCTRDSLLVEGLWCTAPTTWLLTIFSSPLAVLVSLAVKSATLFADLFILSRFPLGFVEAMGIPGSSWHTLPPFVRAGASLLR